MSKIPCPNCSREMDATASVCVRCRRTIEIALANIGAFYTDLDTVRAGQTRYGSVRARRGGEQPLGLNTQWAPSNSRDGKLVNGRAVIVERETRTTLLRWYRYVTDAIAVPAGPVCLTSFVPTGDNVATVECLHLSCARIRKATRPHASVPALCGYLIRWADWLRVSEEGFTALRELTAIEAQLRRLVDAPAPKWFAGPCSAELDDGSTCTQELLAPAREGSIKCPACLKVHDIAGRRKWMLEAAEDYLLTAAEMARAVSLLSEYDVNATSLAARIRQWAARGRLEVVHHIWLDTGELETTGDTDKDGRRRRPVYRVRDVLDLLNEDARNRHLKRSNR